MNVARWEAEHARRFCDEVGLVARDEIWRNGELHLRARRLAAGLVELGVAPGDRIAIALPNSQELFVACSATWLAGAVLVVLGDSSAHEVAKLIDSVKPTVLVGTPAGLRSIAGLRDVRHTLSVGPADDRYLRFDDVIAGSAPLERAVERGADDIAQICYTSGATGEPKGVVYTHGGIDAFWRARASTIAAPDAPNCVLLALPPTAFGARFIGMRVLANNKVVLLPQFDPERVLAEIERHGVNDVSLVPTMAEQLVAYRPSREYDCSSLRVVNISGAHVTAALVAKLKQRFADFGRSADRRLRRTESAGDLGVVIHYGMTETGGGFASTAAGGDGVVGHVSPGVEVRIVGTGAEDVAPGEIGEIVVRTPYAASGYWDSAEATAAVFRDGYVHTGDLGQFDATRQLRVLGRVKDLIIQGGQNIFPEEIAQVVRAIDEISECAVVGIPDELLGEIAVVCAVRAPGSDIAESSIRRHCRSRLPARKQPGRVELMAQLPRTATGKVKSTELRSALLSTSCGAAAEAVQALREGSADQRRAFLRQTVERELREALTEPVAIAADLTFGDMGLDSIGAVQLAHSLAVRLGLNLSPTLIYAHPTVDALAAILHETWSARVETTTQKDDAAVQVSDHDPVAIVGIGCRLPGGASDPEAFWQLLRGRVDASRETPESRVSPAGEKWRAAFLEGIDQFDADFFRLAAEADELDPRQRLVLEVGWEALENAGCDLLALAAARTGAFLGISGQTYSSPNHLGASPSMAVARLCHFLDIRGPVMSVDTTCSSSLVAVHCALTSLRSRDCDMAIAGGVSSLATPPRDVTLGVLAEDGRSKAFDARADGFGQGEGCVLLVLKRLATAIQDRDRVYAVLRGSAINHDGRSSSLTAPNARAQAEVIQQALANAKVTAESVQYVEAHGTGTLLGDPIEVDGLNRAFGDRDLPLSIGSVKTNIGHTEAAAGAAGLVKAALAIFHRELPASLHFATPNPHVPWKRIAVRVQAEHGPWPRPDAPLIAGVSSFGMSGTNAHAVLSEAPPRRTDHRAATETAADEQAWLLPLSAKTPESLAALAARYAAVLDECSEPARDVAYTASCRRTHFDCRLAVVGSTHAEWADGLRRHAAAVDTNGLAERRHGLAMVFSGQGSQWWGMARELVRTEPVFRRGLELCAECVDRHVSWRLLDELERDEADTRIWQTDVAQPALFAFQVALYGLWASWGVVPTVVIGHSLGEIAAAHVCGALSLEQAAWLVCERGRRMHAIAGAGLMATVSLSATEAAALLAQPGNEVEIAASNSPRRATLTGPPEAVRRALESFAARDIEGKLLRVDCAFHSKQLDDVATEFAAALGGLEPREATIPLVSTLTAEVATSLNPDYWARQMRRAVDLHGAVQTVLAGGCLTFLEIGSDASLSPLIQETIVQRGGTSSALAVPSLRRGVPARRTLLDALGRLYSAGHTIDWPRQYSGGEALATLPTYAWRHRTHRLAAPADAPRPRVGPFVGHWLPSAAESGTAYFEADLDLREPRLKYLSGHRVQGNVWFPAAGFLELVFEAAGRVFRSGQLEIGEVRFERALVLKADRATRLQVVMHDAGDAARRFEIYTRDEHAERVVRHASGVVRARPELAAPTLPLEEYRRRCASRVDVGELAAAFAERGFELDGDFMCIGELWAGEGEALARLVPTPDMRKAARDYALHPALLDAAFRIGIAARSPRDPGAEPAGSGRSGPPLELANVRLYARGTLPAWAHVRVAARDEALVTDVRVCDETGVLIGEATGLVSQITRSRGHGANESCIYRLEWRLHAEPPPGRPAEPNGTWLLFQDDEGICAEVCRELRVRGARVLTVDTGDHYRKDGPHYVVRRDERSDLERLFAELDPELWPLRVGYFWGLATSAGVASGMAMELACRRGVTSALHVIQGLLSRAERTPTQLNIVTRGAQPACRHGVREPAQASLWGFAASLAREHPAFRTKLIDLDPEHVSTDVLCAELGRTDPEDRVALRGSARFVARLTRHAPRVPRTATTRFDAGDNFRFALDKPGLLDSIHFERAERRPPGPAEIEVRVHAAALNFRDVLIALGRYPGERGTALIGGECSGVVERIGDQVSSIAVGQEVVLTGAGLLCGFATVPAEAAWPKPPTMSFAEGAATPVAFATALLALEDVARVKSGERVLIHSASGGVGLAAIQYCRRVGAEIYATAGAEHKRSMLRDLGVEHVFSSRDESWVEGVLGATAGAGVDVVLNSLSGRALVRGLEVLAPLGRFVELGKRDIFAGSRIPLSSFKRNATFSAASLDVLPRERLRELYGRVWQRVADGFFRPLPTEIVPMSRVGDAFVRMMRALHVGKIVLTAESSLPTRERAARLPVRPDGSYLITGGFGALGLAVAERLLERGAKHLLLVGRGLPVAEVGRKVSALAERYGAQIAQRAADVGDRDALEGTLTEFCSHSPALVGVVHCAGVAADAVIANLDDGAFRAVMDAKVAGGWNLHLLTRDLDFFVLFSSTAGVLGSAGQANYAAAGAFLDALAHYRHAAGLAAQSIDWGSWRGAGMSAGMGVPASKSLAPDRALDVLELLIAGRVVQAAAFGGPIEAFNERDPHAGSTPFYSELRDKPVHVAPSKVSILQQARNALADKRREMLNEYLHARVADLAQVPPARIRGDHSLSSLGIDSLGVVRLRAQLADAFGEASSAAALGGDPTIDQLLSSIVERIAPPFDDARAAGSPLVWLRSEGDDPTLVFVHPAGGGTACYRDVATALPFRFAAIESPALRREPTGPTTVTGMARSYVEMLGLEDPSRPLVVGGWSLGGLVAYEMAAMLGAAGRDIPLVVLLDPRSSNGSPAGSEATSRSKERKDGRVLQRFLAELARHSRADIGVDLDAAERMIAQCDDAASPGDLLRRAIGSGLISGILAADAERLFSVFRANIAAVANYVPSAYEGRVLLVRAAAAGAATLDGALRTAAPNLLVARVEADHYSIMAPPAVAAVAELILSSVTAALDPRAHTRDRAERDEFAKRNKPSAPAIRGV